MPRIVLDLILDLVARDSVHGYISRDVVRLKKVLVRVLVAIEKMGKGHITSHSRKRSASPWKPPLSTFSSPDAEANVPALGMNLDSASLPRMGQIQNR